MASDSTPRRPRKTLVKVVELLGFLSSIACQNTIQGAPPAPSEPDPHAELPIFDPVGCLPTSASVVATIFQPACGGMGCHGEPPFAVGLDLLSAAPDTLVGRSAATCEGHALVVPGSPELSFLYDKVASATPACGDPMPFDAVLSVSGKTCIADWIRGLAPDGGCEKCGGTECVVLAADPANCGACGNQCEPGLACVSGACACPGGGLRCDAACVDAWSDLLNCGACGNVCPAGAQCTDGACVCPAPGMACDGACVDPNTNASHCGACGNACPTGSSCAGGQCDCSAPLVSCGATCVDMTSDPSHCGDCATACAASEVCLLSSCAEGCGALTQCGASCADTDTSTLHCGACNAPCAAGLECGGGRCVCPGGKTLCGTACVDTSLDAANCGACGQACGPTDTCEAGSCLCDTSGAVSFTSVIAPRLEAGCTAVGCHSGVRPKENLLLTAAAAYDELVDVNSEQCSGKKLVAPGSPSSSYLINKLLGVGMCFGTAMPKADMRLPRAEIDAISAWICAGAPRD